MVSAMTSRNGSSKHIDVSIKYIKINNNKFKEKKPEQNKTVTVAKTALAKARQPQQVSGFCGKDRITSGSDVRR